MFDDFYNFIVSSRSSSLYNKVYHSLSGSLTVNITTGVLAGYTYIITVVPVNILEDGYPNKTIGYLDIIISLQLIRLVLSSLVTLLYLEYMILMFLL